MPSFRRHLRGLKAYIEAEAARQVFVPTCAFCNMPVRGNRCQNCGAPVPKETGPVIKRKKE